MIFWSTIFCVSFAILFSTIIADDPCRFEYHPKGVIDLTSLGNTDGTAAFVDDSTDPTFPWRYTYNPCQPYSEKSECINVSVCQSERSRGYKFVLGTQNSAKWLPGDDFVAMPSVSYSYEINLKKVKIILQCSNSEIADFRYLDENPPNTFYFLFSHKCACWNGCSNVGPVTTISPLTTTTSSGGGGCISYTAVIVIILLVFVIIYCTGLAAYYRLRLQISCTETKAEQNFSITPPTYEKDGVVYA